MKYRDTDYSIRQGIKGSGRFSWGWSVDIPDAELGGTAASREDAVAAAHRAIDRARTPKKMKLRPLPARKDAAE